MVGHADVGGVAEHRGRLAGAAGRVEQHPEPVAPAQRRRQGGVGLLAAGRLDQGADGLGGAGRREFGEQPAQGGALGGGEAHAPLVRVLRSREFAVDVGPGAAAVEVADVLVVVVEVVGLDDPAVEADLPGGGQRQGA